MPVHNIEIHKKFRENNEGNIRTEIWAEIKDICTGTSTRKLIWWEDDEGIYHDETPDFPIDLREAIDNAWIEKSRKW